LKVGRDFVVHGVKRLVNLFRKRVSIERVFSRAKEWLLLDHLRVRGLEQAFIHACLSFSAMLIRIRHKPALTTITPDGKTNKRKASRKTQTN